MERYKYMCAHRQTRIHIYIYLYMYIFSSSSWSGYNYFSLQGILRALPGSSNKVHRIVERSKGSIIEGEEQNSFLSCIVTGNRLTPLKTITAVSEPRYFLPAFQEGNCSSCSTDVYRGATMLIFPFWWISSCFQTVWTVWYNILCIICCWFV